MLEFLRHGRKRRFLLVIRTGTRHTWDLTNLICSIMVMGDVFLFEFVVVLELPPM